MKKALWFLVLNFVSMMSSQATNKQGSSVPSPSPTVQNLSNLKLEDFSVFDPFAQKTDDDAVDLFDDALYELHFHGKKVTEISSIGGFPNLEQLDMHARTDGKRIVILHYDGGSAGTKAITNLDRMMVLVETKPNQWSLSLDTVIGLSRYSGEDQLLELKRKPVWTQDFSQLDLDSIDEYPKTQLIWSGDKLVPKPEPASK